MEVAELLRKAHEVLKRDGWSKGLWTDHRGRHCIMGALDCLYPSSEVMSRAQHYLEVVALEQYPRRFHGSTSIMEFNDASSTRWPDVERVFEKAIVRAEEVVE